MTSCPIRGYIRLAKVFPSCGQNSIAKAFNDIIGRHDTQFSGFAQIGNSFIVLPEIDIDETSIIIGFGKIGIALDSRRIIGNRRFEILPTAPYIGPIIVV